MLLIVVCLWFYGNNLNKEKLNSSFIKELNKMTKKTKITQIIYIILLSTFFIESYGSKVKLSHKVRLHENFIYKRKTWIEITNFLKDTSEYEKVCMKQYKNPKHIDFCPKGWESMSDGLEYHISTVLQQAYSSVVLSCTKEIICKTTY